MIVKNSCQKALRQEKGACLCLFREALGEKLVDLNGMKYVFERNEAHRADVMFEIVRCLLRANICWPSSLTKSGACLKCNMQLMLQHVVRGVHKESSKERERSRWKG